MKFDLRANTILLTLAGSQAYGLATELSDIDVKGVAIPPKEYYFGVLDHFQQADSPDNMKVYLDLFNDREKAVIEKTKLEGSVYELRKFCDLALSCNANVLDVLFCRDEDVRLITPAGQLLRDNRELFISAKARWTYVGYAVAQAKRIASHRRWLLEPMTAPPEAKDFGLDEVSRMPRNQFDAAQAAIQKKLDSWNTDYGEMSDAEITYVKTQISAYLGELIGSLDNRWRFAANLIGFDDNLILRLERERRFETAKTQWKQYQDWKKNRNPERAALESKFGYDCKHASQLYRLLLTCEELLTTGKVNVWRQDREEILAVKNGQMKYEDLMSWVEAKQYEIDQIYLARTYVVPHEPDRKRANDLMIRLIENQISSSK